MTATRVTPAPLWAQTESDDAPTLRSAEARGRRADIRRTLAVSVLAVGGLVSWALGTLAIDANRVGDWGLPGAAPSTFFVGIALLVMAAGLELSRPAIAPKRLGVLAAAFVFVLQATAPLVYPEPRYTWLYKHIGVVSYLDRYGHVSPSIDIYHSWPGFFAASSFFDRVAGVHDVVGIAAWAPLVFSALACAAVWFVLSALPLTDRERWIALFIFIGANWVGAEYFSPQAFAFVLCMTLLGIALTWLRDARTPRVFNRALPRLRARLRRATPEIIVEDAPAPTTRRSVRFAAVSGIVAIFTVVVFSHQMSPYLLLAQLFLLTVIGALRPRWLVFLLAGIALGFFASRFAYVEHTYGVLSSLGDFLQNLRPVSVTRGTEVAPDIAWVNRSANALTLCVALLAGVGLLRRLRNRRPTLVLVALVIAPATMIAAGNYGGEAVYRVYLFTLPIAAALGASAFTGGRLERAHLRWMAVTGALMVMVALMLFAFFGLDGVNRTRSGEVAAARFIDTRLTAGSVIVYATPNFPARMGARYDQALPAPSKADPTFLRWKELTNRVFQPSDLDSLETLMASYGQEKPGSPMYLVMSEGIRVYAEKYGYLPRGSLPRLEQLLRSAPRWRVVYENADARIYEFDRQAPAGAAP